MELQKTNQLVRVGADCSVSDYEHFLNGNGFTGGYQPLSGSDKTLAPCLSSREPNYFFLKYGGLEELCVGGSFVLHGGQEFTIKTAPRAATGPDLRRVLIGSGDLLGHWKEVVLRIFPLPEKILWGSIPVDFRDKAQDILRSMVANFIRPSVVGLVEDKLFFQLAGFDRLVNAERKVIESWYPVEWIDDADGIQKKLIEPQAFSDLQLWASPLLMRAKGLAVTEAELGFKKFFNV